jgi:enediyne biosynthesis protein E4
MTQSRNVLIYMNQKNGKFKEMSLQLGVNSNLHDISRINIFDINKDGFFDIIIHHWDGFDVSDYGALLGDNQQDYSGYYDKIFIYENGAYKDQTQQYNFSVKTKKHTAFNSLATDINNDGFIDLIVANDFDNPDYVYLNNQGKSFATITDSFFKVTSFYSMGSDAADIDNDGLIDFVTCDMRPANNYRSKTLRHETPYTWHYMLSGKKSFIENQMVRNTLQVNNGDGTFSEIGEYAGIDATDWSWAPLLADFDNDGYKDLFITNGVWHPDVFEFDFIHKVEPGNTEKLMATMQADTIAREYFTNYLYRNNGDYTFADKRNDWGFEMPVDSRGAAYADFDNDGDLDIVVNNSNAISFIYRNDLNTKNNFIRFKLQYENNLPAWHSSITIYYSGDKKQHVELNPIRGFYATSENMLHFGIGKTHK